MVSPNSYKLLTLPIARLDELNILGGIYYECCFSHSADQMKVVAGSEAKAGKLRARSVHEIKGSIETSSSNNTKVPNSSSHKKSKYKQVNDDSRTFGSLSVTEQTSEKKAVSTSAQPVTTAKMIKWDYETYFLYSRAVLTNAERQKLEELDSQHHCFVRSTVIGNEIEQLRPVTLLHHEVPIRLIGKSLYADSNAICITLDTERFPSQASYKCDICSMCLTDRTVQLKNISNRSTLQLRIDNKLQEHSERTNQPVYLSATSGKLKVESDEIYFTKPKKPKKPNNISNYSVLNYNESLIHPYKPSDVQSVLVPKAEFLLHLDKVLANKSAYEKEHGLINLPITIYDVQTGERIHCYESQLFNPEEKKGYFKKLKIFRHLLNLFGLNPYKLKGFQGVSPKFFINFVLSLSPGILKHEFRHKQAMINLFVNLEDEGEVDLRTLCKLLADGANLNFTVKNLYSEKPFIKHVIDILATKRENMLSKDMIENQQRLIYILIRHLQANFQSLLKHISVHFLPVHLVTIVFITMPDFVYREVLILNILTFRLNRYPMERNLHLHFADYVSQNMNDSLCKRIIARLVSIRPHDLNSEEGQIAQQYWLNILGRWKSLSELKPEILIAFKENFEYFTETGYLRVFEDYSELGVDLAPILSLTKETKAETRHAILNQVSELLYSYHLNEWSHYLQSKKFKQFPKDVDEANKKIRTLPDHLKELTLPTSTTVYPDIRRLLESLKQPFAQPLTIPDINDSHQSTRVILDRYYRMLGPNRVVDIENLDRPPRSHLHGSGHALRVSTNIRLLMQLLERYELVVLSQQQKQLLEYAAIYHDAAAEDVMKDREEIDSAGYFRRDMIDNCPAIYQDDIIAIAEAMEHKEDDIHNEENAAMNQQQRLYRRLLRFADRLDIARCLSIPEDFPNFEHNTNAGKTADQVDARLLDLDAEWLNHENFRKTLVSCIHGLLDLAAVSGGATKDQRAAKSYIKNNQLNPNASERLNQFFEKTPTPLTALEDLLNDNVRRYIAQRAGLNTCGDPEHRQCEQQQEHNKRGVVFGYTRYIHNRYHDLVQVRVPEMQLWEKLAVQHDPELLSQALQSAIANEVKRLKEVGIKRNIGNPAQETLAHPDIQHFLTTHHGLDVVAEEKLREVIPATIDKDKVYRKETILMLRASENKV